MHYPRISLYCVSNLLVEVYLFVCIVLYIYSEGLGVGLRLMNGLYTCAVD